MELSNTTYRWFVEILALTVGLLLRDHVSTLFENDRHFSHLSEIEREMSFRTEMGMYYYYYKIIIEAPNWTDGLKRLWNDTHSQYPNHINAQKSYNLLPEIVAGFLYHKAKAFDFLPAPECWQIERGEGLSSVKSCQGLAVPSYFYIEFVWCFAAMTGTVLFLYATYLSESIYGGIIASLAFIFNHTECTRVQWTPPLRESFAYPILLWQMYNVTIILDKYRSQNKTKFHWKSIFSDLPVLKVLIPTTLSLTCWQFSQFILTTQVIAILILQWMKIIPRVLVQQLAAIHMMSIIINGVLGNYFSFSLYAGLVIGIFYSENLYNRWEHILSPKLLLISDVLATLGFTYLQNFILSVTFEDYSHVFDILKAKLTDYSDFHTLLYTCSAAFDFLPYESYEIIIKTLLLPTAILAGFLVLYCWYRNYKIIGYPQCIEPSMAYNALQIGAFIVMAVMIMRLKLFMNPHLCIISGCVVSKKYLEKLGIKSEHFRELLLIAVIAGMGYHGLHRIKKEGGYYGEYSNIEQEELFEWIKANTPVNAVFAGKMSVMANLLLSTRRPIVNNPYYESKEMRDRTLKVYEIYSRKDAASVYETLRNMQVDYLVLEEGLCYGLGNTKPGCRMIDLWDVTDNGTAKKLGKRPLCRILYEGNSHPFKRVFGNNRYLVLSLDYSTYVEFKPKVPLLRS